MQPVSERQEWFETAVLGTMMGSDEVYRARIADLRPEDFQMIYHRSIFDAMVALAGHGKPCDLVLIKGHMERAGLTSDGSEKEIIHIVDEIERGFSWMTANADHYADELRKEGSARRLVDVSNQIRKLGKDEFMDAGEKLAQVAKLAADVERESVSSWRESIHISGACRTFFDELDALVESGSQLPGLRTGYPLLDEKLGPLEAGQVVVLAAQTSVGKSAFGFNLARNAIIGGIPTLFCAIEMPRKSLVKRWVAMEGGVSSQMLRDPQSIGLNYPIITEGIEHLNGLPLFVDDASRQTVASVRAQASRIENLGLIVVDYLQIMADDGLEKENRHSQLANRMNGLREIAKDFRCPLVVMSQLNRDVDKRNEKRPQLSDLRESGSIEENANVVLMLYRPEYHERKLNPGKFRGAPVEPCEVIIGKNREGELGICLLGYEGARTKFHSFPPDAVAAYWRNALAK